jgi:hypothetical protein
LSYSTHHSDYFTNDTATAADSHAFLRSFFKRYPHLQQNDFYIAGEHCSRCSAARYLLMLGSPGASSYSMGHAGFCLRSAYAGQPAILVFVQNLS